MTVYIFFTPMHDDSGRFVEISATGIQKIRVRGTGSRLTRPLPINIPNGQDVNLVLGDGSKVLGFGHHKICDDITTVKLKAKEDTSSTSQVTIDFKVTLNVTPTLEIQVRISDDFENWSYSQANEVVGMFYNQDDSTSFLLPNNFVRFVLVKAPTGYDWAPHDAVVWTQPMWIGKIDVKESDLSLFDRGGPSGAAAFLQIANSSSPPEVKKSPDPTLVNRGAPDDPDRLKYSNEAFSQNP